MGTSRKSISRHHALIIVGALIVAAGLTGCAAWRGGTQFSDPLTAEERLNLGVSYEHAGKLDLAMREYERAATGRTRSIALAYQGNIFIERNDNAKAEEMYRAALKADSDNVVALNNLTWLLAQEGRALDEAERMIRHALTLDPEPRDAYENTLESILEARGNRE